MFVVHDTAADLKDGPPVPAAADWVNVGRAQFSVGSFTSHTLAVTVVFESWDGTPPEPGDWSDEGEFTVDLPTGRISVWQLTAGPAMREQEIAEFVLPRPGTYRVRARADGRGEAALAYHEVLGTYPVDSDEFQAAHDALNGLERYLFQFWPSAELTQSDATGSSHA